MLAGETGTFRVFGSGRRVYEPSVMESEGRCRRQGWKLDWNCVAWERMAFKCYPSKFNIIPVASVHQPVKHWYWLPRGSPRRGCAVYPGRGKKTKTVGGSSEEAIRYQSLCFLPVLLTRESRSAACWEWDSLWVSQLMRRRRTIMPPSIWTNHAVNMWLLHYGGIVK